MAVWGQMVFSYIVPESPPTKADLHLSEFVFDFVFGGLVGVSLVAVILPWRRGWQPTPVLLPKNPMNRGTWWATVHGVKRVGQDWATDHINKATYYGWLVMPCMVSFNPQCSKAVVPNLCDIRDGFHGRQPLTSWCVAQFVTGGWGPRL